MYPFYEVKKNDKPFYFNIFISSSINFPQHLHSNVELVYVMDGEINVGINEKCKLMKKGELAFSFPNDIHSYETPIESKVIIAIFSYELINGFFGNKMDVTLENPYLISDNKIFDFLNMLLEEFNRSKNDLIIKGLLYAIFGKMESVFKYEDKKYIYDNTIQLILKYIEGHFTENLSLDSLSKNLGFSKYYISRLFTNKIGYQFNEYINRLRINMAQSLLTETDISILNIALECGFDSQRSFNRVFKSLTSTTPTEFRKTKIKSV